MTEELSPKPPGRVRGRPFEKGRSGNTLGRRVGCPQQDDDRRRGTARGRGRGPDPQGRGAGLGRRSDRACGYCLERVLPPCRDRMVKFALPPIESAADIAPAMKAVTSALADGMITPAEAATIAAVVDTFMRAIETSDFERRLRLVEADHFNQPDESAGMYGGTPNGYCYNP